MEGWLHEGGGVRRAIMPGGWKSERERGRELRYKEDKEGKGADDEAAKGEGDW